MPNYSETLDRVFQALADPTRRAIVQQLGRGPASVGELAKAHRMGLPAFLQHVLEGCGLISSRKLGRVRTCQLDGTTLEKAENWISGQRTVWEDRLDRLEAYVNELQNKETDNDPEPKS